MIHIITGNSHKLKEAQAIIPELKQLDIDLPEIQDIDARKIIEAKLKEAVKHHDGALITEDVSLHLDCLNGFPGPLIKWVIKKIGYKGIYDLVSKYDNNNAKVVCLIGFSKDDNIIFFEGIVEGKIVEPKVHSNFGFDPIFQPNSCNKTFAAMAKEEKNAISHRRRALDKLKEYLAGSSNGK